MSGPKVKYKDKEIERYDIPSEEYLLAHRLFTFLDEWLFYFLMGVLFFTENYYMMLPVGIIGGLFVANSYRLQWKMEKMRYGPENKRY